MNRPGESANIRECPGYFSAYGLTPEAVRERAAAMGEAMTALSDKIFLAADHPEQAARRSERLS